MFSNVKRPVEDGSVSEGTRTKGTYTEYGLRGSTVNQGRTSASDGSRFTWNVERGQEGDDRGRRTGGRAVPEGGLVGCAGGKQVGGAKVRLVRSVQGVGRNV